LEDRTRCTSRVEAVRDASARFVEDDGRRRHQVVASLSYVGR
jgi:hypothetical protein